MLIPLASLSLCFIGLVFTILVYCEYSNFINIQILLKLKQDKLCVFSVVLLSISLTLGIVGQLNYINPSVWRTIRFCFIVVSGYYISLLLLQSFQFLKGVFTKYFSVINFFKNHKWLSKCDTFLVIIIFYIMILLFFLFFGDRVGWEGDDIEQLDGIINFSYKGKDLVYRYYWQPLTYQLNLWLNYWLNRPKFLFFVPQIIGAANVSLLFIAVYIFSKNVSI